MMLYMRSEDPRYEYYYERVRNLVSDRFEVAKLDHCSF